jgi:hypothetical protein
VSDLEVARYALRTFRPVANEEERDNGGWSFFKPQPTELASVSAPGPNWLDGTCTAQCKIDTAMTAWRDDPPGPPHQAPHEDCHCGVYGALTLERLQYQYSHYTQTNIAVIAAEGQTLIGTRGLRTQYARVVAYWCLPQLQEIAAKQFADAKHYTDTGHMLNDYHIPQKETPDTDPVDRTLKMLNNLQVTYTRLTATETDL